MEYRCIHCGFKIKMLYVQYSPGNIRLMKCGNCKAVADEYIECEIMILLIDLILQKQKAYRHMLFNVLNRGNINLEGILWNLGLIYFILDAYILLLKRSQEDPSLLSVWACGKVLIDVVLVNFTFLSVLLFATRILLNSQFELARYKDLFLAIVVSSYFKIFLLTMGVWEFPTSVLYVVDMLVLSSNAVALRVWTKSTMAKCFWVCLTAHAAKYLVNGMLELSFIKIIRTLNGFGEFPIVITDEHKTLSSGCAKMKECNSFQTLSTTMYGAAAPSLTFKSSKGFSGFNLG